MKRASGVMLSFALLAQACGPAPQAESSARTAPAASASAEPSSVPASPPASTPTVTPSPSAAPPAARAVWESVGPPEPNAEIFTGLWDGARWIVGGRVDQPGCLIWNSEDGRTWTPSEVPEGGCNVITAIMRGENGYIAAGTTCDGAGRSTGVLWRSDDALHWERLGSLYLGELYDECIWVEDAGITDAGIIVTSRRDNSRKVSQSSNGIDWKTVSPETFGVPLSPDARIRWYRDAVFGTDIIQVDPSTAVLATGCGECPVKVWRSGDDSTWTQVGEVQPVGALELSIASGPRLVVARENYASRGVTTTWTLDDDGVFRYVDTQSMSNPKVAYAGDGYLLAGTKDDLATGAVSLDGLEWTDSPPNHPACAVRDVIGGSSLALVVDRGGELWLVDVLPG